MVKVDSVNKVGIPNGILHNSLCALNDLEVVNIKAELY